MDKKIAALASNVHSSFLEKWAQNGSKCSILVFQCHELEGSYIYAESNSAVTRNGFSKIAKMQVNVTDHDVDFKNATIPTHYSSDIRKGEPLRTRSVRTQLEQHTGILLPSRYCSGLPHWQATLIPISSRNGAQNETLPVEVFVHRESKFLYKIF
jgi:hypothetical protein